MDVRTDNRGRPHQKVCFPVAPVVGRNFLTAGHSGTRVRNACRIFGQKVCVLCSFFLRYFQTYGLTNLWFDKPMVCTRVALHENDGNHETTKTTKTALTATSKELSAGLAEITENAEMTKTTREFEVQTTGSPNSGLRDTRFFFPNEILKFRRVTTRGA